MTDTPNEQPEPFDLNSDDVAARKRADLKRLFPEVFNEDKIDLDQLRRVMGDWVDEGSERFGLTWPGKAACMRVIQAPATGALRPDRDQSANFDRSKNVFIEGDNLEVLKLLQKAYFGKIKMIYIDPPYNTGKEFIYPDRYAENLDTYLAYTGQKDDDGKKFATNSDLAGRFHSNWLNMMFTRIFLAKNLLSEDGVIVIHIDEHEFAHLNLVMNMIFGEENNLGPIVWDKKNPKGDSSKISTQHEYLVCYAKNFEHLREVAPLSRAKANAQRMLDAAARFYNKHDDLDEANTSFREWIKRQDLSGGEAAYKFIDKDGHVYRPVSMAWPNKKKAPDSYFIPLKHPVTGKSCPVPERGWRNPPEKMKELLEKGLILFGADETKQPERKYLLHENMEENIPSVIPFAGSDDALMNQMGISFDNPKPVAFLQNIIEWFTSDDDAIIDFFAGSASTAHAIMRSNHQREAHRNWILVQLPEPIEDKDGQATEESNTISALARERLSKVAEEGIEVDFRAFGLSPSAFTRWEAASDIEQDDLLSEIEGHAEHVSAEASDFDMLFEILLKDGFELTTHVETVAMKDGEVFSVADGALLICLERNLTKEIIDALADLAEEKDAARVVCLDAGFQGNDQLKTNAVQTFKSRLGHGEDGSMFRTV